jgi:hypothetical protein
VSILFDSIERSATYPAKMQWYKKLAQILLLLSVIDFALAAPVVAQEHEMRVSVVDAAIDGTNAPPIPIPRSSDSGHWREHNPRFWADSNGSPESSNPAPHLYDEPDPLNPSLPYGNTDLNPLARDD